ncbi:hypothetical protein EMIT0196P_150106 [Pseudomonas chlororaphis]
MHTVVGVVGIGLVAVDLGPEQVGVELQALVPQGALETQFGVVGALGADQQRVGPGGGRRADGQVDPAGFLAVGQGRVAQQIVGEAVAEVEQARGAGAVLVEVAGVVGPGSPAPGGGRGTGHRGATHWRVAGHPGAFFFIGAAQAGGEVQAFGEVPGALGEQREAVGADMPVADAGDVVQGASGRAIPDVRLGSVIGEGFVIEVGAEVVGAEHVVEETAGRRGQAEFLGPLLIFHRDPGVVAGRHIEAVVVARGEIPPAVGADRGQGEVAGQGPVGLQRGATLEHRDMLVVVQVDLAVCAVDQGGAGRGGPRLVLVDAIDGRPGAVQHSGAGAGIFFVVVADPAQVEVLVGLEQQLATEALARAAVEVMAVVFVLDIAVAAGAIGRKTPGQLVVQRPGNSALGLEVAVLAHRGLDAALGGEARCAGADVDHPGGGVLAEQRALGTAQHFQLLDVHQVEHRHARPSQVDVVDVQPDAAFQAIAGRVVAQAADRHAGLARVHVGDVDARHQLLQILDAIDPLALQGLATDHAHRRRYVLGALLATPRGHGHGFQLAAGGGPGGIGLGRGLGGRFGVGGIAVGPAGATGQQQGQRQALEPSGRSGGDKVQRAHGRLLGKKQTDPYILLSYLFMFLIRFTE